LERDEAVWCASLGKNYRNKQLLQDIRDWGSILSVGHLYQSKDYLEWLEEKRQKNHVLSKMV